MYIDPPGAAFIDRVASSSPKGLGMALTWLEDEKMSPMGSSRLWGKISVLIAVCGWGLSAQAKYDGGSGEPNNPYQISSVSDWQELMATPGDWDSHFVLTGDIDLNDVPITPVGNDANEFSGVFDGNDYVIRNADVNMPGSDYVGLFGYLGTNGQIRNLGVEDASILGRSRVGGLVGRNEGTLNDCYTTGNVNGRGEVGGLVGLNYGRITTSYTTSSVNAGDYVGGLVGFNDSGRLTACYATGSVNGSGDCDGAGGLVGANRDGNLTACYASGAVDGSADGDGVGGLVGANWGGSINGCYATGQVSGSMDVSGLVGWNVGTVTDCYATGNASGDDCIGGAVGYNNGPLTNCYSTGSVEGYIWVGGLVGYSYSGPLAACFWDLETSGQSTSAGGAPKTTAEMKTQSTFTDAAWDFIEVWDIGENQTYPFLRTYLAGDINHDGVVDFRDITHLAGDWLSGL